MFTGIENIEKKVAAFVNLKGGNCAWKSAWLLRLRRGKNWKLLYLFSFIFLTTRFHLSSDFPWPRARTLCWKDTKEAYWVTLLFFSGGGIISCPRKIMGKEEEDESIAHLWRREECNVPVFGSGDSVFSLIRRWGGSNYLSREGKNSAL